ncbi:hypothetical protein [Pedobacter sp. N36a]|uniref:hypothetical protein n=1 Tax=Pedobacter sp. N36a TaxID=2767996 RepID=UPI00165751BB|nr:hypothetical protein [Pedobacter sp. N36a]
MQIKRKNIKLNMPGLANGIRKRPGQVKTIEGISFHPIMCSDHSSSNLYQDQSTYHP